MRFALALWVWALALLTACNSNPTPPTQNTTAVGGSLTPTRISLQLNLGAIAGNTSDSKTHTATLALEGGHLPVGAFDGEKAAWERTINAWPLESTQKQSMVQGIHSAFDKLRHDLNLSLDRLPDEMQVQHLELLRASFKFKDRTTQQTLQTEGLYNPSTGEYALGALSFSDAQSNDTLAILGLAAWGFSGSVKTTAAKLTQAALGALVVKDVGAVSVSLTLEVQAAFSRTPQ